MTINRMNQRRCLPVTVWNQVGDSLITWPPALATRHVRFGAGFIQKDQLGDVQSTLLLLPAYPSLLDVTSLLLARMKRLFYACDPDDGAPSKSSSSNNPHEVLSEVAQESGSDFLHQLASRSHCWGVSRRFRPTLCV